MTGPDLVRPAFDSTPVHFGSRANDQRTGFGACVRHLLYFHSPFVFFHRLYLQQAAELEPMTGGSEAQEDNVKERGETVQEETGQQIWETWNKEGKERVGEDGWKHTRVKAGLVKLVFFFLQLGSAGIQLKYGETVAASPQGKEERRRGRGGAKYGHA